MTQPTPRQILLALLASIAMSMAALPSFAACCEAACCPDEVADHGCYCCGLSDCGVEDAGFAVMGSGPVLAEPVAVFTMLPPGDEALRQPAIGDVVPTVPPFLTTTVLLI